MAVLIWPADTGQTIAALSTADTPLFVALGVLGAGLSFFLYVVGLRHTAPVIAAIVAMVEPVTASAFGPAAARGVRTFARSCRVGASDVDSTRSR